MNDDWRTWGDDRIGWTVPWSGEVIAPPEIPFTIPDFVPPEWLPQPAPETPFFGVPALPQWGNVWEWAKTEIGTFLGNFQRPAYVDPHVTQPQLTEAVNATAGASIKAMSGYINRTVALLIDQDNLILHNLNQLVANVSADADVWRPAIYNLQQAQQLILTQALPALQAQILQLEHDLPLYIQYAALSERQWTIDHVFTPLYQGEIALNAKVDTVQQSIPTIVRQMVPQMLIPVVGALAALGTKVASITKVIDECAQPMCDTMGPKTNLGKFLKGLAIAADLALLAELASLTEPELVDKLRQAGSLMARLVADFEGYFSSGTETLGQLFASVV